MCRIGSQFGVLEDRTEKREKQGKANGTSPKEGVMWIPYGGEVGFISSVGVSSWEGRGVWSGRGKRRGRASLDNVLTLG